MILYLFKVILIIMKKYDKKILDIDITKLPFKDFLTSRHSMTVKVNAQKTYECAKKENISFFNLCLACQLEAINEISEFKRRIINNNVIEYEKINAITPILQNDFSINEIEVIPPSEFPSILKWNNYLENKKKNIKENQYTVEPNLRDSEPIANFSCIPWIHFESMTNIIASSNQLMPVVSWGKLVNEQIPISLTASHIFVFGYHFKLFYEKVEKYLTNPKLIF